MLFLTLHCVVAVVIVLQNDVSAEKRISFARTLANVTVKNAQRENRIRQIQSQTTTDGELQAVSQLIIGTEINVETVFKN